MERSNTMLYTIAIRSTVTFLLLLTPSIASLAQTGSLVPAEYGVTITLPDGWSTYPMNQGGAKANNSRFQLGATDSAGQSFTMHIFNAPEWWVASDGATQEKIEGTVAGEGMTITKREVVMIGSEEAYRYEGVWNRDSGAVQFSGFFALTNGYAYSLFFTTLSKISPWEHPHLTDIANSFAYTTTPRSHYNPDTLAPVRIDMPEQGLALTIPGSWKEMPIAPGSGDYLLLQATDLMNARSIYIEKVTPFPAIGPTDSTLVAEMEKRLVGSGFTVDGEPKVILFKGKETLSLNASIPGEARAQLLVTPGAGMAWTIMVILQGDALAAPGSVITGDLEVKGVMDSMELGE